MRVATLIFHPSERVERWDAIAFTTMGHVLLNSDNLNHHGICNMDR